MTERWVEKDIQCTKCSYTTVNAEVDNCSWVQGMRMCEVCGEQTMHQALCNGGVGGYVWKFNKWTEENSEGHVEYLGTSAYTMGPNGEKVPYTEPDGSCVSNQEKYAYGAIKDRERENKSVRNHERGKSPLFFLPRGN